MSETVPQRGWFLPQNRSLVVDGCWFAKSIPFYPVERPFQLGDLARLRAAAQTRISWTAIFLKAYAQVATRNPVLRRYFLRWPWNRVHEHEHSVGMLAMNREFQGEDRLCWGRFIRPETKSLVEIQAALDDYQSQPVEQIFRQQVFLSQLPGPLRKLIWWLNLNAFLSKRAKRMGTFSLSSLAGQGAWNRFHFTVLSNSLTYGPVNEAGECLVTVICDHRVIDGTAAARALIDLERTLQGEIAAELQSLNQHRLAG